MLVVRSVLRERGNDAFARLSAAFSISLVLVAAIALPPAYVVLAAALLARAVALPIAQRRLAGGPHPLRPVHVGIVEMVASLAVVLVALAVPA